MGEHLIKVIDEKENGNKSLFWNKKFIETSVKKHFPEIYPQIIEQIEKDKQDTYFKVHEAVGLRYTPSSNTISPGYPSNPTTYWNKYVVGEFGYPWPWHPQKNYALLDIFVYPEGGRAYSPNPGN